MGISRVYKRMYTLSICCLIIMFITLMVVPANNSVQAASNNMLVNSGFETLANGNPSDWTIKVYTAGPVVTVDSAVYREGTHSMKIDATAGGMVSHGAAGALSHRRRRAGLAAVVLLVEQRS